MSKSLNLEPIGVPKNQELFSVIREESDSDSQFSKELLSTQQIDIDGMFRLSQYKLQIDELHRSELGYECLIESLYKKIAEANDEITDLRFDNQRLRDENVNIKLSYSLKLQKRQEDNELKVKKKLEDIDLLLKDLNCKTVRTISEKLYNDIEIYKNHLKIKYEKDLNSLKTSLENRALQKEKESEELAIKLRNHFSNHIKIIKSISEVLLEKQLNSTTSMLKRFRHSLSSAKFKFSLSKIA